MSLSHVPGELSATKLALTTIALLVLGALIMGGLPITSTAEPPADLLQRHLDESSQALARVERRIAQVEGQIAAHEARLQQLTNVTTDLRERSAAQPRPRPSAR